MTRTAFIAWILGAWLFSASVIPALAQSTPTSAATANTQVQASDAEEPRLSKLAQRMAAGNTESGDGAPAPDQTDTAPDPVSSGKTPLIGSRTPLVRPGSSGADEGDEVVRPGSISWFMKTLTALGLVIGLALLVRWGYIRLGGKVAAGSSPVVEVLSRTAVAPRSHVMLLRVGGRVLVVSDSSSGMRTLASLEDAEEVADILGAVSVSKPNSISRGFGQFLHRFSEDHEQQPDSLESLSDEAASDSNSQSNASVSGLLSRVRAMGRQGGES